MKVYVPTKTSTIIFTQPYLQDSKTENNPMSMNKSMNKHIWYIHTMKYYLTIKWNELLIYIAKYMDESQNNNAKWKKPRRVHIV